METICTIAAVRESRRDGRVVGWVIIDAFGERYHTKDSLKASLAERAMTKRLPVEITHHSGWYYRTLDRIALVEAA